MSLLCQMIFPYFNRIFIFIIIFIIAEKNYKYKISDFLKYFMNFKNYILFEKIDIGLNNKI